MGHALGHKRRAIRFLTVCLLLSLTGLSIPAFASPPPTDSVAEAHAASSSFSPSHLIFSHVSDAYSWHIMTVNGHHVALPLPVILYSRTRGELHVFLSSRFGHSGEEEYAGFRMVPAADGSKPSIVEAAGGESPIDLSLTKNAFAIIISCLLMLLIFIPAARAYGRQDEKPRAPKGLQNVVEYLIIFLREDVVYPNLGKKRGRKYMPYLFTLFFFILINNLMGLVPILPGGANVTGNVTITATLALCTFFVTNLSGNKHYWRDMVDMPGVPIFLKLPIPLMPIVETLGALTKPVVLTIRLFANMLAGHLIVLVLMSLIFLFGAVNAVAGYAITPVSLFFGIFMTALDILVSVVQAYVFTLLSAIYIGMATHDPHEEAAVESA